MAEQGNEVIRAVISQWLGDDWRMLGDLAGQEDAAPKLRRLQSYFGDRDIQDISRDNLIELLRQTSWTQLHGDELPKELAKDLFTVALAKGLHEAVSQAQHAAGIKPADGIMGPQTVERLNKLGTSYDYLGNYTDATQTGPTEGTVLIDQPFQPFNNNTISIHDSKQTNVSSFSQQPNKATGFDSMLEGFNVDAIAKKSTSDIWTTDDQLGYASYAQAIAKMILDNKAEPPLTISIQAPWGQGKTSLMRMIKDKLERGIADKLINKEADIKQAGHDDDPIPGTQTKLNNLTDWIKREKTEAESTQAMLSVEKGTIPCIWFNPLYFQNSKQVWSGLAHTILHQLVNKLPKQIQKERFWFRLHLARLDTHAIRRDITNLIFDRWLRKGLVWIGSLLLLMAYSITNTSIGHYLQVHLWPHITAIISGPAYFAYQWLTKNKDWALNDKLAKYIQEPDYESNHGLLHLVDQDLDRALELLLGKDGRLCVFIDDLDRCSPATANDILLAINQFISVQHRKLYFILGMDTHMVAMAIETASGKQVHAYAKTQHTSKSYGWRFMEKFIQLPFFIPRIQLTQAENYMECLLREKQLQRIDESAITDIKYKIANSADLTELQQIVTNFKREHNVDVLPEVDACVATKLIDITSDQTSETFKKLIDVAFADLELNPREIKRFLNIARLLFIRLDRDSDVGSEEHMLKVVRASHLILNWPQCLRWLQGNARSYTLRGEEVDPVQNLDALLDNPGITNFKQWHDSIADNWGEDVAEIVAVRDFYTYCRRIHASPPNLQAIFDAGIF